MEDCMSLDFAKLSPEELLAAESAVLTMRSLVDAAKAAPHGHGMECVEAALHERGFEHLRRMLQAAVASHEGAQKKGSAVSLVPAEKPPRFDAVRKRTS
jgi:O-acetyl-ADP-ribose deacetylase (regulator of RNase III)